jgi:TRAP-type mannitol/chloroaromatic compound transport system permease small subunit
MKTVTVQIELENDDYSALQLLAIAYELDSIEHLFSEVNYGFMKKKKAEIDGLKNVVNQLRKEDDEEESDEQEEDEEEQ